MARYGRVMNLRNLKPLHLLSACVLLIGSIVAASVSAELAVDEAPVAEAAVTNCTSYTTLEGNNFSRFRYTRCTGKTANPPYTTQYRSWIRCAYITGAAPWEMTYTGPWVSVGVQGPGAGWSVAQCPSTDWWGYVSGGYNTR
jgi:hypothetical protein